MPHYLAIDLAVSMLSPVIILTLIPAVLHYSKALLTFGLRGSEIPMSPINIKSQDSITLISLSKIVLLS